MGLIGHKTPSMFRRYGIVNDKDLRVGVEQLADYQAKQHQLRDKLRDKTPIPFPKGGAAHA